MNKKWPYEQLCIDLIIVIRTNTMRQAYFVSYFIIYFIRIILFLNVSRQSYQTYNIC